MNTTGLVTDAGLTDVLVRLGLLEAGETVELEPLSGGVSSDIWVVRTAERTFAVKRALERLKVQADWHAPLSRVASESAWLQYADEVVPGSAPRVLAFDPDSCTMALEYLDPSEHRNWKSELLTGRVDAGLAASVATRLGRIHAASSRETGLAAGFDHADLFESLRIEPYLVRTAAAVPEAREALEHIVDSLRTTRIGLVHGDVSPKNILLGAEPVFLDAECATWGDPVFDAAFCLTHLVLKRIHLPAHGSALRTAAEEFERAYLAEVDWEDADAASRRIDRIVPALLLARVAGASPVEYLDEPERARVRELALDAIQTSTPVGALLDDHEGTNG
jgi:tRNA A-37 threonylcarbamoyl transferase component Bud32